MKNPCLASNVDVRFTFFKQVVIQKRFHNQWVRRRAWELPLLDFNVCSPYNHTSNIYIYKLIITKFTDIFMYNNSLSTDFDYVEVFHT